MDFFTACELAYNNGVQDALHNRVFKQIKIKQELEASEEENTFLYAYLRGFSDTVNAMVAEDMLTLARLEESTANTVQFI